MARDVYYQFIQAPERTRRAGARGGKATARNRLARGNGVTTRRQQLEDEAPSHPVETTAEAIARLDAKYPWLRGAEARFLNRSYAASVNYFATLDADVKTRKMALEDPERSLP